LIQTFQRDKFKFELQVHYLKANDSGPGEKKSDKDRIKMLLMMPDNMWFSIGFGKNMNQTDMIVWHANGKDSEVIDYFSKGKYTPQPDEEQNLEAWHNLIEASEEDLDDYPKVNFLIYRDLDTGDAEKDFLIELDTEL
jgi:hypothetical protein